MGRIADWNLARCIPVVVGVIAAVNCLACGSENEYVVAISGTEDVTLSRSSWSISVSPDEQILAFWELRKEGGDPYDAYLCTLDLKTLVKTVHGIHDVYSELSSLGPVEPWEKIGLNFRDACWVDSRCYVNLSFRAGRKTLVFDPSTIEAGFSVPPPDLTCSDCPPRKQVESTVVDLVGRWLLNHGRLYSSVRSENHSNLYLYHVDKNYDGARILQTSRTDSEIIIQHPPRKLKDVNITALRISPNERYLAYGLFLKLRSRIPLPDQKIELHVYDRVEKKNHLISSGYRYISNLVWSPDSERLYFAGIHMKQNAVYRVNIAAVSEDRQSRRGSH